MKKIKPLILIALAFLPKLVDAQFSQLGRQSEFMMKYEVGYLPFVSNIGSHKVGSNYEIDLFHQAASFSFALGRNISQDWFLGAGLGGYYYFSPNQALADDRMGASAFVDFDFRPIWQGVMGLDYQPVTIKWAPEVGGRVGLAVMVDDMAISPLAEVYVGLNWFYRHGLRQMEHNWHSFYLTGGAAYMNGALYLPIRLGWRW